MNTEQNQVPQDMEKLKEIPKWTRKYAQNRMLTNLIYLIISLLISFIGIGGASLLAKIAFTTGHIILFWICIAALFAILICLVYINIPKLGGIKIWRWIDKRIYGHEGNVSIPELEWMKKKKWVGHVARLMFCVLVFVLYALSKKYVPIKYMQPVSALYAVPFMVFLYFWQKPKVSLLILLWPVLYTIHAILIVAGAPILFSGDSAIWNIYLPVFGYGALTLIISHVYGRFALKKLKGITHIEGDSANGV